MKKALFTLPFITISFILTACGSGGGGGGVAGTLKTPDGTKISLDASPKGLIAGKTKDGILLGQNNDASFYGVWRDDAESTRELRYQGTEATNIPTSGIAVYKGDAIWLSGYDKDFTRGGKSTLNVDFANKTVDGNIKFLDNDEFRRDITLHKTYLHGSTFEGQASVFANSNGKYKGGLYGENAKEAAGVVDFGNNSKLDVSFSGKKQ